MKLHRQRLVQDPVHTDGTLCLLKGRIEEDPDRILKNTVANSVAINPQNSVSHLEMRINSEIFTCVSLLPKLTPIQLFPSARMMHYLTWAVTNPMRMKWSLRVWSGFLVLGHQVCEKNFCCRTLPG
jgi:hypothetical protein